MPLTPKQKAIRLVLIRKTDAARKVERAAILAEIEAEKSEASGGDEEPERPTDDSALRPPREAEIAVWF